MKIPSYLRPKYPVLLVAGLGGLFTVVNLAPAQLWQPTTATAPAYSWRGVAASADFTKLVGAMHHYGRLDGNCYCRSHVAAIYTSTDSGASWLPTSAPDYDWEAVASSADGVKLVAVSSSQSSPAGIYGGALIPGGFIYASEDGGTNWMLTSAPINGWTAVASSADGARLVAAAGIDLDSIYTSPDSGATWQRTTAPSNYWSSVACSADGTKLVAAGFGDGIYISTNCGATWTKTSAPATNFSSVACSADGLKQVVAVNGGLIYISTNSGAVWTPSGAPFGDWVSVTASADGAILLAVDSHDNHVYVSTDSGTTWAADASYSFNGPVGCSSDGQKRVGASLESLLVWPYRGPWKLADMPPDAAPEWQAVASSADGENLVAVSGGGWDGNGNLFGDICTSSDAGATWVRTSVPSTNNQWLSVASSADGKRLVAASGGYDINGNTHGHIYTSTNSGAAWAPNNVPNDDWISVACSADGAKLIAAAGYGSVFASLDSGATWRRASSPSSVVNTVACSADGSTLVAARFEDSVYTSTDWGTNWRRTSGGPFECGSVASSADGTKLIAADLWYEWASGVPQPGYVYVLTNSATTWTRTSAPLNYWFSASCSADGRLMAALASNGSVCQVYTSKDFGDTWEEMGLPCVAGDGSGSAAIACSANASNIVAASNPGGVCVLRFPPQPPLPVSSPALTIARSSQGADISWLVPSSSFMLQQNSDSTTTNWTGVPTFPSLNFTNLHFEVSVTPTNAGNFYRLKQE